MLSRLPFVRLRRPRMGDRRGIVPRHGAERYALQRRTGFPFLRFFPDIEREFREAFLPLNAFRIRIANLMGLAAMLFFIVMDTVFGSNLEPAEADWILVSVATPCVLVPIAATFHPRSSPHVLILLFLSAVIVGLALVWVVYLGRIANPAWFPYESLMVVTMYFYFVSGLLFEHALIAGAIVWAAFVATNWRIANHDVLLYEAYYLLLSNIVGALGLFLLEYELRRLFLAERELRLQATLDSLTGVMNRRAFRTHLNRAWRQAQREGVAIGLILLDIDHFKLVNDRCGHVFGDAVLRRVAQTLKANTQRPLDAVGRYGGDEFIAVWFDVEPQWFEALTQQLPQHLRTLALADELPQERVTISGGAVLARPCPERTMKDAIRLADAKLYEIKSSGRDGIALAQIGATAHPTVTQLPDRA